MKHAALIIAIVPALGAFAQNTVELPTQPPTPMPSVMAPNAVSIPPAAQPPAPLASSAPAPAGKAEQTRQDPNLEFVAVEAVKNGQKTELSEGLKPFAPILKKLNAGDTYRIVAQEAKVAPYAQETQWTISPQYDAFVLPMDLTAEGAVRIDTRVAMNSNGTTLNALRAEGELPQNKTIVFRGLEGSDGSELLLFLHVKNDGQKGDGESSESGEKGEEQEQEQDSQKDSSEKSDATEEQQAKKQDEEKKEEQEKEKQEEQKMAKAEKGEEKSEEEASNPEDENIEALLRSLEEEDQQQQQDARFTRKEFILPRTGEWW